MIKIGLESCDSVEGLVVYGSYGRGELDYYSDIDSVIYTNFNGDGREGIESIKETLSNSIEKTGEGIQLDFERHNTWVIYTKQHFIKMEVRFENVEKAKDDIIFIVESRIESPEKSIVIDKNGRIAAIFRACWIQLNDKKRIQEQFLDNLTGFLYYYDGFQVQFARGDVYRAYMNYTLAFYKIASLIAIVEGEYQNLYQPWFLINKIIKNPNLQKLLYSVSSTIEPLEMFSKSRIMESVLYEILAISKINWEIKYNQNEIQEFFQKIREKYPPFYNFRDISLIPNQFLRGIKIREGLIFRSASLSRFDPNILLQFLEGKQIHHIIDLRPQSEIEYLMREKNRIYSTEIIQQYVINIPIDSEINSHISQNFYENLYYAILKNNTKQIEEIFLNYFADAENDRLIIHCEGGKDRTGVIIALLLDILGVPREYILEDYCTSYSDTDRKNLDFFFDILDKEYGGSQYYLEFYCDISEAIIKAIKHQLVIS